MQEREITPEKCETCLWYEVKPQWNGGNGIDDGLCHFECEPTGVDGTTWFCSHHQPRVVKDQPSDYQMNVAKAGYAKSKCEEVSTTSPDGVAEMPKQHVSLKPENRVMGKRKLTPAEDRAWADLAQAARRLRQAEECARRQRQAGGKRPQAGKGVAELKEKRDV